MTTNDGISLITARRAQVDTELTALRQREKELQAELADLDQAERTLARLSGQSGVATGSEDVSPEAPLARGKPPGTPPVTEMIRMAIATTVSIGGMGAEPRDMVTYIARRWWPDVKTSDVGPIAWRMWTKKQLRKKGSVYMLPENETADAKSVGDTSAVSNHNPELKAVKPVREGAP